ncbi:MAG: ATP-dependent RecD-like DNA helicase [Ruminococcaceae bacterium]|nr:ATP-dependent RecD-like DNA helicase [Oscillospiraceae bacterium]
MEKFTDNGYNEEQFEIAGTVEHIIYQNEENGYTVCEIATVDDELVTVVGEMPFLGAGEMIKAMGKWTLHATFGRQFRVEYYEKELPASENAILKYLSSRTIKGIGPSLALKIVGQYGVDSFDVIENHPEWLAEIPGISLKKAKTMSEDFKAQFGLRSVMMFCRDFFGPATAVKIYKKWGGGAIDIIKRNPYMLCDEIYGIGFEKADAVAKSLGVDNYKEERIRAGIKYVLSFNAGQNGHVFIPRDKLIPASCDMLGADEEMVDKAVADLIASGEIVQKTYNKRKCIYLDSYYQAEKYSSDKLQMLDNLSTRIDISDIDRMIMRIESDFGVEYAAMQKKAIINAVNSGVMVLTGGPGTGKTTVIRGVIRVFEDLGYKIALAAPTGRAAKRMSESTFHEAKTIHRLLEMDYSNDKRPVFRRNENSKLEENIIIIDEASMVDIMLFSALLQAIKPGAKLILIGDSDQLPSVGAGNVLNDIIRSDRFNTVELKEIFRQEEESLIVTNAHAINDGEYPKLTSKNSDFFFLARDDDEMIAKTVAELCAVRLPKTYGKEIISDIQVITPSRKGSAGTEMLNSLLQRVMNPKSDKKREKKVRDVVFREGDKVMQIKNNYDIEWVSDEKDGIGIFNGDIGTIKEIDVKNEVMKIVFDDNRYVNYDFSLLDELEHAYAITVHKSQGSEYPVVIIPMYSFTPRLMTRNLLYTAVTRAQKMVILVGKANIVQRMVDTNIPTKRYTGLEQLLCVYE